VKGLILSGGKGTRLRPLTFTSAKQLVPVANKPILFYGIEDLAAAGIRDIGIVVGDTAREIAAAVGDGSALGVRATYLPQEAPLGLAHAVLISREWLGDDPFVMYLGDNILRGGIGGLVENFIRVRPDAQILLAKVPDPNRFGVAELDGDRVVGLEEKPRTPRSDLALVGVYMFSTAIHEAVRAIRPSERGELEITDALQHLLRQGRDVRSHLVSGWWKDTGKISDLLEANRLVLDGMEGGIVPPLGEGSRVEGRVRIGAGCRILRSTLRGPAIVGQGVVLEDAHIGPYTSIGDGAIVRRSEVEHSILLDHCRIEGVPYRLVDSLVGRQAELTTGGGSRSAVSVVAGDMSRVVFP